MFATHVTTILTRELRALARELEAYPDDGAVWRSFPGVLNCAGTLALHLTGNIQHYVGAVLGGTEYRRDRTAEFARRDVPRRELAEEIERAIAAVRHALPQLTDEALHDDYPQAVADRTVATDEFLLHLVSHLSWHLGQVDYHRRMVTGRPGKIGAVAVGELASARPAA
jgi:uncharacterized damage-inducible protein DinB